MYQFQINGVPKVQKQTRLHRGYWYDPSKKDKQHIQSIVQLTAPKTPLECAIYMQLTFFMPIPKSTPKKQRNLMQMGLIAPVTRPDFDNLAYLVTNALKGIVYKDDSYVTDCFIRKRYSDNPRTEIEVTPIDELGPLRGAICA